MPDKDLQLLPQVQQLIGVARSRAVAAVNAELTVFYWQIGKLLKENVLEGQRAAYGKGWSREQLRHCLRTAESFPSKQIVYALCTKLSWSRSRKTGQLFSSPLARDGVYWQFVMEACGHG